MISKSIYIKSLILLIFTISIVKSQIICAYQNGLDAVFYEFGTNNQITNTSIDLNYMTITNVLDVNSQYIDILYGGSQGNFVGRFYYQNNTFTPGLLTLGDINQEFLYLSNSVAPLYDSSTKKIVIGGVNDHYLFSVVHWEMVDNAPGKVIVTNTQPADLGYGEVSATYGVGNVVYGFYYLDEGVPIMTVTDTQKLNSIDYKFEELSILNATFTEVYPIYSKATSQLYFIVGNLQTAVISLYTVLMPSPGDAYLKLIYSVQDIEYVGGTPATITSDQTSLLFYGMNNNNENLQFSLFNLQTNDVTTTSRVNTLGLNLMKCNGVVFL